MILPLLMAAAMPPAPAIRPVGPWQVNMEENMCLLERSYPDAKGQTMLVFQPLLDLNSMEVYVITPAGSGDQQSGKYKVQVEPGARSFTGKYYSVKLATKPLRYTRLFVDRVMMDGLRDGDTISIDAKPVRTSFAIVRPEKALPILQGCINDLKKSWGIDPDRDAAAVTKLEGDPARYFGSDSYPAEALTKGVYGRVVALLNISAQGTVENCRIVSSAGSSLNEGTCKAARRARFTPPVDAGGKPIATTYLLPVRWVLPGAPD